MTIDSSNTLYVIYRDPVSSKASVMKLIAGTNSWTQVGLAEFSLGNIDSPSISIDKNNVPYVSYSDWGYEKRAVVMKYNGNNWTYVGSPGFSAGWANWLSMALDKNGNPFLTFDNGGAFAYGLNFNPDANVNSIICEGSTINFIGNGGTSYNWTGPNSYNSNSQTPSISNASSNNDGIYSVTIASGSCTATNTLNVQVNPSPTLTATTTATLLCQGNSVVLSANGTATYTWNTGSNTASISVSPTATTSYSVMGTDNIGCIGLATITQSVDLCQGFTDLDNETSGMLVYPNPATNVLNIVTNNISSNVLIYNSIGSLIYNEIHFNSIKLDIKNLVKGIYFLELTNSENNITQKSKFVIE
jgi:hypothetical protein